MRLTDLTPEEREVYRTAFACSCTLTSDETAQQWRANYAVIRWRERVQADMAEAIKEQEKSDAFG